MLSNSPIEQELLKYTKGLSEEALLEVIDFIQFLKFRKGKKPADVDLTTELSFIDSLQTTHLEQEFKDYKNLYPRE